MEDQEWPEQSEELEINACVNWQYALRIYTYTPSTKMKDVAN